MGNGTGLDSPLWTDWRYPALAIVIALVLGFVFS